jgi:trans-aconitate methyltransferase
MIDQDHKKIFEEIWEKGNYRLGSTAQRMVKLLLDTIPAEASINDYGSGTGRAEVEILKTRPLQKITMIDIAENALEDEAKAYLFDPIANVSFIMADLADLSEVPHADWGICINVLMTVQPDKIDIILKEIRRTCDNLIMEVYDFTDTRLGEDRTTVKKNAIEWMDALQEHWRNIEYLESLESKRRYIFVCKG